MIRIDRGGLPSGVGDSDDGSGEGGGGGTDVSLQEAEGISDATDSLQKRLDRAAAEMDDTGQSPAPDSGGPTGPSGLPYLPSEPIEETQMPADAGKTDVERAQQEGQQAVDRAVRESAPDRRDPTPTPTPTPTLPVDTTPADPGSGGQSGSGSGSTPDRDTETQGNFGGGGTPDLGPTPGGSMRDDARGSGVGGGSVGGQNARPTLGDEPGGAKNPVEQIKEDARKDARSNIPELREDLADAQRSGVDSDGGAVELSDDLGGDVMAREKLRERAGGPRQTTTIEEAARRRGPDPAGVTREPTRTDPLGPTTELARDIVMQTGDAVESGVRGAVGLARQGGSGPEIPGPAIRLDRAISQLSPAPGPTKEGPVFVSGPEGEDAVDAMGTLTGSGGLLTEAEERQKAQRAQRAQEIFGVGEEAKSFVTDLTGSETAGEFAFGVGRIPGDVAAAPSSGVLVAENVIETGQNIPKSVRQEGVGPTAAGVAGGLGVVGGQVIQQAEERPARFTGSIVGETVLGTAALRGASRASKFTGRQIVRRRADTTADIEDLTSKRVVESDFEELPEFETDPNAPTREAVAELERRAADQPDELTDLTEADELLMRSESERLPDEVVAQEGEFELPGLFTAPDLSPLRLTQGGQSSFAIRLPRPSDFTPDIDRASVFPGDRIEGMPDRATGSGIITEAGERRPDPTTGGYRFLTEQADEGTAFVRPAGSRTTELEAIFPPGSQFQRQTMAAVDLPEGTATADIYRRVDDVETAGDTSPTDLTDAADADADVLTYRDIVTSDRSRFTRSPSGSPVAPPGAFPTGTLGGTTSTTSAAGTTTTTGTTTGSGTGTTSTTTTVDDITNYLETIQSDAVGSATVGTPTIPGRWTTPVDIGPNDPTTPPTEGPTDGPSIVDEIGPTPTEPPTSSTPTEPPTDPITGLPTQPPTDAPTSGPTEPPTSDPTQPPTGPPTSIPTEPPTEPPTSGPTQPPTSGPTEPPTSPPTEPPTSPPSSPPTEPPTSPRSAPPSSPPTSPPGRPPTTPPTTPPTKPPGTLLTPDDDDERRFRFEARGEFAKRFGFNVAAPEDIAAITDQALDLEDTGRPIGRDESFVETVDDQLTLEITEAFGEPTQADIEEMEAFQFSQQGEVDSIDR